MKRNIAYVRVSTTAQLEGNGPAAQRADITNWAAMTGTTIDEWVTEDETGTEADREQILLLKQRAAAGELGTLVISQTSRLGRELWVSEHLFNYFAKHGVEVVSANELFGKGRSGVLARQVMGAVAQYQKDAHLDHMKATRLAATVGRGTSMGGQSAYGYRAAGKGALHVDAHEARLVARTFDLAGTGITLERVAELLAEEGFRTRKGTRIARMQVLRLLRREGVYRGQAPVNHVELEPGVKPAQPAVLK
jgi:DNA invertase Pin-like site-specific DNA recombinase